MKKGRKDEPLDFENRNTLRVGIEQVLFKRELIWKIKDRDLTLDYMEKTYIQLGSLGIVNPCTHLSEPLMV